MLIEVTNRIINLALIIDAYWSPQEKGMLTLTTAAADHGSAQRYDINLRGDDARKVWALLAQKCVAPPTDSEDVGHAY